jgi:hypothetical protein
MRVTLLFAGAHSLKDTPQIRAPYNTEMAPALGRAGPTRSRVYCSKLNRGIVNRGILCFGRIAESRIAALRVTEIRQILYGMKFEYA